MLPSQRYSTWAKNRSVRLAGHDYRAHAPYHVIIQAANGKAPFRSSDLAQMACRHIFLFSELLRFYLGAFCLMPDHLHLLFSPADSGLSVSAIVGRYKGRTTNESWKLGWSGRLWQRRFYDHIVRRDESVPDTARYIIENPERAGLPPGYEYRWHDPMVAV